MKAFRTISAIALAFLVLVSSTDFTVGVHYCMGKVKDVAFFAKADVCKNEKKTPPCHRQTKPCCEDETIVHKGDDLKTSASHLCLAAPDVIEIEQSFVLISEIIPVAPAAQSEHHPYDPPLRTYDITVVQHVFLI